MFIILIIFYFRWRDRTNDSDEEEEEEAPESGAETDDDEESSDEDAGEKGAHALIEIENPNRVHKKAVQKVSALNIETTSSLSGGPSKSGGNSGPKPELSRREREEIDKQKAQAAYQKLHSQGKTEQAKADLARLAIIKQQRQEAADRREKERKGSLFNFNDLIDYKCFYIFCVYRKRSEKSLIMLLIKPLQLKCQGNLEELFDDLKNINKNSIK